jgi:succinoglycan biosynthesis protein ExoA
MSAPHLLIVIPCLNEEAHLPALLDTLCADPAAANARIVVADGGSTDASIEIVRQRGAADPRVTLLSNPQRIQSAGANLAVRMFGEEAEFLVRVDAHAAYPADYISQLLRAQAESGADSVTVSMHAVARRGACFQRAAAAAQNSVLGAGGSPHRKSGARRWVDHGHHALFTLAAFRAVGGYDESFTHNEDAELDARLKQQGARILLAADIRMDYFPRATPSSLAHQYFRYGQGRARTAIKNKRRLESRQLLPIAVAPAVALAALAPLTPWAVLPAAVWLSTSLFYGVWLGIKARSVCAAAAGLPAAIMHLAWSSGFLWEAARMRRASAPSADIQHNQA